MRTQSISLIKFHYLSATEVRTQSISLIKFHYLSASEVRTQSISLIKFHYLNASEVRTQSISLIKFHYLCASEVKTQSISLIKFHYLSAGEDNQWAMARTAAEQVQLERRFMTGVTGAQVLGLVIWLVAISTDHWTEVTGIEGRPVYVPKTGRYLIHANTGIWRTCRLAYANKTQTPFYFGKIFR